MSSSGNKWKIQIKRSRGIRPKLIVNPEGILVILPEGFDESEVCTIVERHKHWIEKKHTELIEALEHAKTVKLIKRSKNEFRNLVKKLVEQATKDVLGINPCRIVIRKMKTRWASCSPKGTITINELAKYLPDYLISYIIYHEICHILEPRHNEVFWKCVQKRHPNHKELEKELLVYEVKLGLHYSIEDT